MIGPAKDVALRHGEAQSAGDPPTSRMAVAGCTGGKSTGARTPEGLQRISESNLKHGRYTKDKLIRKRQAAEVGRECKAKLNIIEQRLIAAGLLDC